MGKGVGGDLFSLSVMPASTFDAVWKSQEGGQKAQCYSEVNDMGKLSYYQVQERQTNKKHIHEIKGKEGLWIPDFVPVHFRKN